MYFYDTGLVSYLCKWQSPQSLMVGAAGAIFETYVVSEIIKSYFNAGAEPFVYYYRDIDAKEIDLILERDMLLFPIEIKKSASADSRDTRSFSVISKSGLKQGTGAVISLRNNFLTAGKLITHSCNTHIKTRRDLFYLLCSACNNYSNLLSSSFIASFSKTSNKSNLTCRDKHNIHHSSANISQILATFSPSFSSLLISSLLICKRTSFCIFI